MTMLERMQILERLAEVNEAQNKVEEADTYYRQAFDVSRSPDVPQQQAITFVRKYLDFANRHGRNESAQNLLRALIADLGQSPEAFEWAQQLRLTLSRNLLKAERSQEAEEVLREGADLIHNSKSDQYTPVAHNILLSYSELLFNREAYREAENVLRFALSMEAAA